MTPTTGAGAGDMNSLIDSSIGDGAAVPDSSTVDTSVDTAAADTNTSNESVDAALVEGEQPVVEAKPEAPPVEDEFAPPDDLSKPDKVSPDGKTYYYSKSRAEALLQGHAAWRDIQSAIPNATVDSVKELYTMSAGFDNMSADYMTGNVGDVDGLIADINNPDPNANAKTFVGFWAKENPESFAAMMANAPDYLAAVNQKAAIQMERKFDSELVQRMYRTAARTGDDEMLTLAQHLDKRMRGDFVPKAKLSQQPDALSQREAAIARREKALNDQAAQGRQQSAQQWVKDTNQAADRTVTGLIDKALARPELKAFEGKPQMNWIKRDLTEKVAEFENSNPAWKRSYDALLKQAQANPSEESRTALVAMKEQVAKNVIRQSLAGLIETATGTMMGANQSAHARAAASAGRRESASAGSPVNGVAVNPKVKNARNMDDLLSAVLG